MTTAVPTSMNIWLLRSVAACQIVTDPGITCGKTLIPRPMKHSRKIDRVNRKGASSPPDFKLRTKARLAMPSRTGTGATHKMLGKLSQRSK